MHILSSSGRGARLGQDRREPRRDEERKRDEREESVDININQVKMMMASSS